MVHTVTRVTINGFITVIAGLALAFCGPGRWQTLCGTPANRGERGKSLFVEMIRLRRRSRGTTGTVLTAPNDVNTLIPRPTRHRSPGSARS